MSTKHTKDTKKMSTEDTEHTERQDGRGTAKIAEGAKERGRNEEAGPLFVRSSVSAVSAVRKKSRKGGKMKAAVFKEKGRMAVEEVPDPKPEADEIILKVKYCSICGSDLHRYAHGMMSPGLIMGHEYAGVVVETGKNVKGFKPGDRLIRCTGQPDPGRVWRSNPP